MFFFNDTATTEIYTLSLHDALPIFFAGESMFSTASDASKVALVHLVELLSADGERRGRPEDRAIGLHRALHPVADLGDRKSTRLNSSHANISYAVFCLKKKTK